MLGKSVNLSVVITRGTARIYLTAKTVRPAFKSHPRYWMDSFSLHVGPCPGTELAGCTVYRVTVTVYREIGAGKLASERAYIS